MSRLGGGVDERWRCVRNLYVWAKISIFECIFSLKSVVVHKNVIGKSTWKHNQGDVYSVKVVCNKFTNASSIIDTLFCDIISNKFTPLKVYLFTWKFVNNRLSTKHNLALQCLSYQRSHLCVVCCEQD